MQLCFRNSYASPVWVAVGWYAPSTCGGDAGDWGLTIQGPVGEEPRAIGRGETLHARPGFRFGKVINPAGSAP